MEDFSKWVNSFFDVGISIEKRNGLVGIFVVNEDGKKVHLIDSGFGISEFLPFLTQIWFESHYKLNLPTVSKSSAPKQTGKSEQIDMFQIIAIEQPEASPTSKTSSKFDRHVSKSYQ